LLEKYLTPKQRNKITWKQGFLGLIGRKMDREQSPAFIREKNEELEKMRADLEQVLFHSISSGTTSIPVVIPLRSFALLTHRANVCASAWVLNRKKATLPNLNRME
jgi:hypothetical protein